MGSYLFTYGILRDAAVMESVAGDVGNGRTAYLEDHAALVVKGAGYPGMVAAPGRRVEGTLYDIESAEALCKLDAFEGAMYERRPVTVLVPGEGPYPATAYLMADGTAHLLGEQEWVFAEQQLSERIRSHLRIEKDPQNDPQLGELVVDLLNHYAADPLGGGEPLPAEVRATLVNQLAQRPFIHVWLALYESIPVGLLVSIESFSTFAARPLLNIHDVVVRRNFRGHGIATLLFGAAEEYARSHGFAKLTLEVLSGNAKACRLYRHLGFAPYQLDPAHGVAEFWQKNL
jgi:GNAT superfamily N-acetyltransferase